MVTGHGADDLAAAVAGEPSRVDGQAGLLGQLDGGLLAWATRVGRPAGQLAGRGTGVCLVGQGGGLSGQAAGPLAPWLGPHDRAVLLQWTRDDILMARHDCRTGQPSRRPDLGHGCCP
jgi:hypothetical protein